MRTPAFLGHTDFTNDLNISYTDYLQMRQFSDSIQCQISDGSKAILTSGRGSSALQLTELKKIEGAIETSSYVVQQSVDDLKLSTEKCFEQIRAVMDWGFTELIFLNNRTNALLERPADNLNRRIPARADL